MLATAKKISRFVFKLLILLTIISTLGIGTVQITFNTSINATRLVVLELEELLYNEHRSMLYECSQFAASSAITAILLNYRSCTKKRNVALTKGTVKLTAAGLLFLATSGASGRASSYLLIGSKIGSKTFMSGGISDLYKGFTSNCKNHLKNKLRKFGSLHGRQIQKWTYSLKRWKFFKSCCNNQLSTPNDIYRMFTYLDRYKISNFLKDVKTKLLSQQNQCEYQKSYVENSQKSLSEAKQFLIKKYKRGAIKSFLKNGFLFSSL